MLHVPEKTYLDVKRVLREIDSWGVKVLTLSSSANWAGPGTLTGSPGRSHIGINWHEKYLWMISDGVYYDEALPFDLLHELAHLIIGVPPYLVDEIKSGMLAFEHYTSKRLRLSGRGGWMLSYNVVPASLTPALPEAEVEWGFASKRVKSAALKESFKEALRLGLLHENGSPTYQSVYLRGGSRGRK